MKYVFLSAFRNESAILPLFIEEFAKAVREAAISGRAVLYLVDDYSLDDSVKKVESCPRAGFDLHVIPAPTNLGNQGAMFYGLSRVDLGPDDVLVTFDCDGEDDVAQIRSILELGAGEPTKVVLIERGRRRESIVFKVAFGAYKLLFRFLTQRRVVPNNFMLIPGRYVPAIRCAPLAAVHFAYGVLKLNPPHLVVSRDRRTRYGGQTSQNLFMLVSHGLVGLMVFYEVVVAKLFMLAFGLGVLEVALVAGAIAVPSDLPSARPVILGAAAGVAIAALALLSLLLAATAAVFFKLTVFNLINASSPRAGATPPAGTSIAPPTDAPTS